LTVKNTIFNTILRLPIPPKSEVLSASLDGNKAEYTKSDGFVEVVIDSKNDFTLIIKYK
jgi:hypothetical protein